MTCDHPFGFVVASDDTRMTCLDCREVRSIVALPARLTLAGFRLSRKKSSPYRYTYYLTRWRHPATMQVSTPEGMQSRVVWPSSVRDALASMETILSDEGP
jgi:hypothetical protein